MDAGGNDFLQLSDDELIGEDSALPDPDGAGSPEVGELLALAAADMDADRLTTPAGNNALDRYREVLSLYPENAAAKAGLGDIVRRYLEMANTRISRQDVAGAVRYVARAENVDSQDPRIEVTKASE